MGKTMYSDKHRELITQADRPQAGLLRELVGFMVQTKKWWLTPIVLSIVIFASLILLGGTATAPVIYTLF